MKWNAKAVFFFLVVFVFGAGAGQFVPDLTEQNLLDLAGNEAKQAEQCILNMGARYDQWQARRAGRTNAQISTDTGMPTATVAEMDSLYAGMYHVNQFAQNQTASTGNHMYNFRRFIN